MNTIAIFVGNSDKTSGNTKQRVLKCAGQFVLLDFVCEKKLSVPDETSYCIAERGKPFFKDSPIHFNVSHSGKYWVCAMSLVPVGIDIQEHIPGRNVKAIADRFFTTREADFLFADGYEHFYDIWAAKESYVKLTGTGIADSFDKFSVVGKLPGHGKMIMLDEAYSCCLCSEKEFDYIVVRE